MILVHLQSAPICINLCLSLLQSALIRHNLPCVPVTLVAP